MLRAYKVLQELAWKVKLVASNWALMPVVIKKYVYCLKVSFYCEFDQCTNDREQPLIDYNNVIYTGFGVADGTEASRGLFLMQGMNRMNR